MPQRAGEFSVSKQAGSYEPVKPAIAQPSPIEGVRLALREATDEDEIELLLEELRELEADS